MFGIMTQDGLTVLCQRPGTNIYIIKRWDRSGSMPVMRKSATEIDQLLQDFSSEYERYDLVVFEFTEEQVENLLIRKLRGY